MVIIYGVKVMVNSLIAELATVLVDAEVDGNNEQVVVVVVATYISYKVGLPDAL